jgi:hypothetical protein
MKAEEIRALKMSVEQAERCDSNPLFLNAIFIQEVAAQLAEANEHLKCLTCPPLVFNADLNTADLSGLDFQPGRLTVMEPRATLRDQFAMAAMQATTGWMQDALETTPETARRCYVMADSMLAARKR